MKHHLLALVRALALAALVAVHAHGLVLFAHSLYGLHDIECDIVGAPVVVVDACRDAVFVAGWGVQ
jgi:hypothetical protein